VEEKREFSLNDAIAKYVKTGNPSKDLFDKLTKLLPREWDSFRQQINAYKPHAYEDEYNLISEQLPQIGKQAFLGGVFLYYVFYYITLNNPFSCGFALLVCYSHWKMSVDTAIRGEQKERALQQIRVDKLLSYDPCFKPKLTEVSLGTLQCTMFPAYSSEKKKEPPSTTLTYT
jgi:hypothetical protein